jgi:hypothetical protein
MTITAKQIIDDATGDLHDAGNVRWSRADLLAWLNDGQREVLLYRPDASVSVVDLPLVAGWLQPIPATALRLLDVKANTSGRSCGFVKREDLDSIHAEWRSDAPSNVIKSWTSDARDPKHFEVWPPATESASLKVTLTVPPVDCANELASISLDDQYKGPLVSYVRHRAYLRDSEDAANAELSTMSYALFKEQLGVRTTTDLATRPAKASDQRKDVTA